MKKRKKRAQGNQDRNKLHIFQKRAFLLGLLMLVCGLFLIVRLFYLQVSQHELYTTLSWRNQVNLQPIGPNRGLIFDRQGVILAENTPIYNLVIAPLHVKKSKKIITQLKTILNITPEDIEQFRKLAKQSHKFDEIPIKMNLSDADVARFLLNQYRYPGVRIKVQLARFYPYAAATAHLLGYVGRIDDKDLTTIDKNSYLGTDYIGKLGLEKFYEDRLHGVSGYEAVETDASGRPARILNRQEPSPGKNLLLTIDIGLQLQAIQALEAHRGAVVAINPNNGEILALVSNPGFDPNLMSRGVNQQIYKQWRDSKEQPLYNRAIRGQYPLASTIKPFSAIGALALNAVNPKDRIHDPGWYKLPNAHHVYHDWRKEGHGSVDLVRAIIVSCDIYFYKLGVTLGINRLANILTSFGFGERTFIDMHEELPGLVATPEWKKSRGERWYTGDTVSAAIGQGYLLTTPLQLASAAGILATRGILHQPHLMRGIVDEQQLVEFVKLPGQKVFDAKSEHWDIIHQAMERVVSAPEGTARGRFGQAPYSVAGKTGTAQVFSLKNKDRSTPQSSLPEFLRDHSLFIAFAPVDKPIIALAVIVENDKTLAPIVARKVLDYYMHKHMGTPIAVIPAVATTNTVAPEQKQPITTGTGVTPSQPQPRPDERNQGSPGNSIAGSERLQNVGNTAKSEVHT